MLSLELYGMQQFVPHLEVYVYSSLRMQVPVYSSLFCTHGVSVYSRLLETDTSSCSYNSSSRQTHLGATKAAVVQTPAGTAQTAI